MRKILVNALFAIYMRINLNLFVFVKLDDGTVVIDKSQKLGGRGVWVHNCTECIEKLKKKKLLNVAFKCNVNDSVYGEFNND